MKSCLYLLIMTLLMVSCSHRTDIEKELIKNSEQCYWAMFAQNPDGKFQYLHNNLVVHEDGSFDMYHSGPIDHRGQTWTLIDAYVEDRWSYSKKDSILKIGRLTFKFKSYSNDTIKLINPIVNTNRLFVRMHGTEE